MNKITPAHINTLVSSLIFYNVHIPDTTTMLSEAFLPNGFSVGSGKSACVDPALFNKEIGEDIASTNAENDAQQTLWQLEGYLLAITGQNSAYFDKALRGTPFERVSAENAELNTKLNSLSIMLNKGRPEFIDEEHWLLLKEQYRIMESYNSILGKRLSLLKE